MFNDELRQADAELQLATASLSRVHLVVDDLNRQVCTTGRRR